MNDDELSYLPEWSYHSITFSIASSYFDRILRNKPDYPPNLTRIIIFIFTYINLKSINLIKNSDILIFLIQFKW